MLIVRKWQNILFIFQINGVNYNVYSTFQSHEPEFDYLKSLEIEEKINQIKWVHRRNHAHFLLSTNGKRFKVLFCLFFKLLFYTVSIKEA